MRKAAALRYERGKDKAPQLIASGRGLLAEKIREIAAQNRMPFYEHSELVDALAALPVGEEIPPELYELVARVFAFVLRLDKEQGRGEGGDGDGQR